MRISINRRLSARAALSLVATLAASSASALDLAWSGFGTTAYTISDQPYSYERFVSNRGSFNRDSIFGLQTDATFSQQWGATAQATMAPSVSDDHQWEPTLTWAFVSYRPSNDLLLRAGKMRMPLYLFSETMAVGAACDMMHLPTDVYSTAPTADFTGASFSKNWSFASGELSLDGYWGKTRLTPRTSSQSASSSPLRTRSGGLLAVWHRDDDIYRVGVQQAYINAGSSGSAAQLPMPEPANPAGALPGSAQNTPGQGAQSKLADELSTQVYLLGLNHDLGDGFRLVSEYVRRHTADANIGKNTRGGYLSVLKRAGPWTPYLTYSRLLSDKDARDAAGSSSAGTGAAYDDQYAWALGASYSLSPSSKVKAEWMRVHVGGMSSLVDTPAGGSAVSRQNINVFSLSYSFVF